MGNPLDPKVEALIDSALNKAVRASGPVKLYHGKYDQSGLFANKKGDDQRAAKYGFGSDPPLWTEESRSSMNQTLFIRLDPGGLEWLIEKTKPSKRHKLIDEVSELYRRELLERWSDMAAAKNWEDDFPRIAKSCETLIDRIQKIVPGSNSTQPGSNTNSENADFKRRVAHELVIAWKHAPNSEAKQSIANALKNSGIQQIGLPKEQLPMDGGLHRCDEPAFPGDKVEVVESGWLVHDGVGEYLLEKAIVKLV